MSTYSLVSRSDSGRGAASVTGDTGTGSILLIFKLLLFSKFRLRLAPISGRMGDDDNDCCVGGANDVSGGGGGLRRVKLFTDDTVVDTDDVDEALLRLLLLRFKLIVVF